MILPCRNRNIPQIALLFPDIIYLITIYTLEKDIHIKIFVTEIKGDASEKVWIGNSYKSPVIQFIHDSISIQVFITDSSDRFPCLLGMVIHLFLSFEDPVGHHSIEDIRCFAYHKITHTITRVPVDHIFGKFDQFCPVRTDIGRYGILKLSGWIVSVSNLEFNTLIIHIGAIDPWLSSFTHSGNIRNLYQHIVWLFKIIA